MAAASAAEPARRVAVVGGGMAGAVCASELASMKLLSVTLFDMGGRGPGGRTSTRKTDQFQFDHGAQFIRGDTDDTCRRLLESWALQGILQEWRGRFVQLHPGGKLVSAADATAGGHASFFNVLSPGPVYVGVPAMEHVCKQLATRPAIQQAFATRVEGAQWTGTAWQLSGAATPVGPDGAPGSGPVNLGEFDALVLADSMTAKRGSPGYLGIAEKGHPGAVLAARMEGLQGTPLFALMVALPRALVEVPFDGASVQSADVQWISRDSSKPGRARADGHECWVAVSTVDYARRKIAEVAPLQVGGKFAPQGAGMLQDVAAELWGGVAALLQPLCGAAPLPAPVHLQAQRWGSAFQAQPMGEGCLSDTDTRLVACGDWAATAPGVPGAIASGKAAADTVMRMLL